MRKGVRKKRGRKGEEGVERRKKGWRKVRGKRYRKERRSGLEGKEEGMVVRKDELKEGM